MSEPWTEGQPEPESPLPEEFSSEEASRSRRETPPSSSADEAKGNASVSHTPNTPYGPRLRAIGPLAMVETAFLASTASLIWLVNYYFPTGPILRVFFPVPIALVYLRWGHRAAWMSALVSGLLLSVLMGPPRSLLFFIPYGLLGVQLGAMWLRRAGWGASIAIGSIIGSFGFFFRIWLLSILLGEDLWVYLTTQITELLEWLMTQLVNFGLLGFSALGQPDVLVIQIFVLVAVVLSNILYLFTVHLAAWLLLERLGSLVPPPPEWVQVLLEE